MILTFRFYYIFNFTTKNIKSLKQYKTMRQYRIIIAIISISVSMADESIYDPFIPKNAHHAFNLVQNRLKFISTQKEKLKSFTNLIAKVNMNEAIVSGFSQYLENGQKADETCETQIGEFYQGIIGLEEWALRSFY